jgi:hypothetical protein
MHDLIFTVYLSLALHPPPPKKITSTISSTASNINRKPPTKSVTMYLPSALESGPHLVLSSAASILQTSTEIPHDNNSNSRPESTIFEDITTSLLQSPIGVPSPPQVSSSQTSETW